MHDYLFSSTLFLMLVSALSIGAATIFAFFNFTDLAVVAIGVSVLATALGTVNLVIVMIIDLR